MSRVKLSRCLCAAPKPILLDEPTEGIQPSIVEEMAEILQTPRRSLEPTVLAAEQDPSFINAPALRPIIQKGMIGRKAGPAERADPDMAAGLVGMAGQSAKME